jgi:dethiobiotin synthetase
VIGAWPGEPGAAEAGNRDALDLLAAVRAVLPAGAGAMSAAEFESMSTAAFDTPWVTGLAR